MVTSFTHEELFNTAVYQSHLEFLLLNLHALLPVDIQLR